MHRIRTAAPHDEPVTPETQRPHQRQRRLPGRWLIATTCALVALELWSASLVGFTAWLWRLGAQAGVLACGLVLLGETGWALRRSAPHWLRFTSGAALVLTTQILVDRGVPLHLRWAASAAAFDGARQQLAHSHPDSPQRPYALGGFRVSKTRSLPGGGAAFTVGDGILRGVAIAYLPTGPQTVAGDLVACRPLGAQWYVCRE